MSATKTVTNSYLSQVELIAPPIRTKYFKAIKDSGLSKSNAWMNFGDIGSMALASDFDGNNASVIDFTGFKEFNNESLRSRIFDVKLVIGLYGNNYAHKLDTYEFTDHDWFEYSITWFYAHARDDAFIGDLISEDVTLPKSKKVEIDITDYFVKQMIKKQNDLGFYITSDMTSENALYGKTKESGTAPTIIVRYYDIPHAGKGITFPPGNTTFNKFGAAVQIPDPDDETTWKDFEIDKNAFFIDSTQSNYFLPDTSKDPNAALNQFRVSAFSAMKVDFIDKDGNTSRTINTDEDIDIDTIPKLTSDKDTYGSISTGDIIKNRFIVHLGIPDNVIDGSFIVSVFSAANVKFFNKAKELAHKMIADEDEFDIGNLPNYYAETDTDSTESDLDINDSQFDVHASVRGDIDGNEFYIVKGSVETDLGTVDKPNQFTVSSGVFDYTVYSNNNTIYYKGMDPTELVKYATIKYDANNRMIGFDSYKFEPGAFVKGIDSDGDVGKLLNPNQFDVYNTIYGEYNPAYKDYEKNKLSKTIDYDPKGMPEISNNKFNVWKGSAFKYNFFDKDDAKIKDTANVEISDVIEVEDINKYSADANTSTILSTGDIPAFKTPQRDSDGNLTGNGAFNVIPLKRAEIDKNRMFIVEGEFAEKFPKEDYDNNVFDVHAKVNIPDVACSFNCDNDRRRRFFIGKPFTDTEKETLAFTTRVHSFGMPLPFAVGIDFEVDTTDDYSFTAKAQSNTDIDGNKFNASINKDIDSKFFIVKGDTPKDIDDNKFQPKWSVPIDDIDGNQFDVHALMKRTAPIANNKFYKFFVATGDVITDIDGSKFQPMYPARTDKEPQIEVDGNQFAVAVLIPDPKNPRPSDPKFFVDDNQFGIAVIDKPHDIDGNTLALAFKVQYWYGHPLDDDFTHVFRVPFVAPPVDLNDNKFLALAKSQTDLSNNKFRIKALMDKFIDDDQFLALARVQTDLDSNIYSAIARMYKYIDKNKFQVKNNADSKSYGFITD